MKENRMDHLHPVSQVSSVRVTFAAEIAGSAKT